jgi:hypothetical protein
MIVSGSSGYVILSNKNLTSVFSVGKTKFCKNMLKHNVLSEKIKHVFYYSCPGARNPKWNKSLSSIRIHFREGLPTIRQFLNFPKNSCVIIDDQFEEAIESKDVQKAFTVYRRKFGFSLILISQNVFEKGKKAKTIRSNTFTYVLFNNFGDQQQNHLLARQLMLEKRFKEFRADHFKTKHDAHSYVVLNNTAKHEDLRVATNIFSESVHLGIKLPILYTD